MNFKSLDEIPIKYNRLYLAQMIIDGNQEYKILEPYLETSETGTKQKIRDDVTGNDISFVDIKQIILLPKFK